MYDFQTPVKSQQKMQIKVHNIKFLGFNTDLVEYFYGRVYILKGQHLKCFAISVVSTDNKNIILCISFAYVCPYTEFMVHIDNRIKLWYLREQQICKDYIKWMSKREKKP